MKNLEVPIKSITDIKKSPMSVFKEAEIRENGVYIFNRDKIAGVVLTQEQYEGLNNELMMLRDKIESYQIQQRLNAQNLNTYSVEEVTGINLSSINLDEHDEWE